MPARMGGSLHQPLGSGQGTRGTNGDETVQKGSILEDQPWGQPVQHPLLFPSKAPLPPVAAGVGATMGRRDGGDQRRR
jgi:hypothetical protein